MKAYMLAQLAFWVQQIIVINIEERRKDHWQMFSHHIITISLIYASYRYGHTRVGNLILVLMDVVDLFLPVRCPCLNALSGLLTSCFAGCQMPQVPWIQHSLRLHVRRFYGLLVRGAPCSLPDCVLLRLRAYSGYHACGMLQGS